MDRELIAQCCRGYPVSAGWGKSRRERIRIYRENKASAWRDTKESYRATHAKTVESDPQYAVGFLGIALPAWMVWMQFFAALWPVFQQVWESIHGKEESAT